MAYMCEPKDGEAETGGPLGSLVQNKARAEG